METITPEASGTIARKSFRSALTSERPSKPGPLQLYRWRSQLAELEKLPARLTALASLVTMQRIKPYVWGCKAAISKPCGLMSLPGAHFENCPTVQYAKADSNDSGEDRRCKVQELSSVRRVNVRKEDVLH